MFHFAFPRGQGPAFPHLPPTLQPCAIASSAPPSDHLRTAALSGLVYLLLGGVVLVFPALTPPVAGVPIRPTTPERIVEFGGPPLPRLIERVLATPGGSGGGTASSLVNAVAASLADPEEQAPGHPTDRSQADPGASGLPNANPSLPPGSDPIGSGTGIIHDFSMVGLAVLHRVDPLYPEFARRARIQGPVVLLMTVDQGGLPIQVQVLEGHPVFHEAAMQAARQWRFEPARMDGRPVTASFRLTVKFSLR